MKLKLIILGIAVVILAIGSIFSLEQWIWKINVWLPFMVAGIFVYVFTAYTDFIEKISKKELTKEEYIEYLLDWKLSKKEKYILIDTALSYLRIPDINDITRDLYQKLGQHDLILRRLQDNNVERFLKSQYIKDSFTMNLRMSSSHVGDIISAMKSYIILHGLNKKAFKVYISLYRKRCEARIGSEKTKKLFIKISEEVEITKEIKSYEKWFRECIIDELKIHIEELQSSKKQKLVA